MNYPYISKPGKDGSQTLTFRPAREVLFVAGPLTNFIGGIHIQFNVYTLTPGARGPKTEKAIKNWLTGFEDENGKLSQHFTVEYVTQEQLEKIAEDIVFQYHN